MATITPRAVLTADGWTSASIAALVGNASEWEDAYLFATLRLRDNNANGLPVAHVLREAVAFCAMGLPDEVDRFEAATLCPHCSAPFVVNEGRPEASCSCEV